VNVVGCAVCGCCGGLVGRSMARAGAGFEAKNTKPSRWGSVSGAPMEMATGGDGRRWWSGAYKVAAAAGCRVRSRKWGRRVRPKV
jgi:hypothetical protein